MLKISCLHVSLLLKNYLNDIKNYIIYIKRNVTDRQLIRDNK